MRSLLALLVVSALAAPAAPRADGSILLSGRAGVARPFGEVERGAKLGDFVPWAYPLQADLQFRFARRFSAGAYARWAPTTLDATVKSGCDAAGVSCSATDAAFGGLAEYRFSDRLEAGPWVGALVGWERLRQTEAQAGAKVKSTASGLEVGAMGGIDFELGGLTLGPWVSLNVGQFTSLDLEPGGSASIGNKELHGWFQLGLRVSLLL